MPKQPTLICPHCGKRVPEDIVAEHNKALARETGKRGGKKTAERGPEYFSKISKSRKKHQKRGGRPPKDKT